MNSTDYFDYSQMFGDSAGLDGSAQGGGNSNMPFYTTANPDGTGNGQVVANNGSSFWSSLAKNLGNNVVSTLPQVVSNLTTPSTPNPTAAGQTQQTTAQKMAAQSGGSWLPWIIGGVCALAALVGGFFMLRKRK